MPYLMGYTSGSTYVMGQDNYEPASLTVENAPALMRRGGSYTVTVAGAGSNLSAISATLDGQAVTVTSAANGVIGYTIPHNFPRKHSSTGLILTVSVAGVGTGSSSEIPFLPPEGWEFTDLVNPRPSTDINSITYNMVNEFGEAVSAVTGDQIVRQALSSPGNFPTSVTPDGAYGINAGGVSAPPQSFQVYCIQENGAIGVTVTKTITYEAGNDTIPNSFTLNAVTGAQVEQWIVSNVVTVQNVDAGLDIPVTITGGEYQVSTDGGSVWGAFTSANTNVQLNYQIRARVFTSDAYGDPRTATLTVGGVSAEFTATTASDPALEPTVTLTIIQNLTLRRVSGNVMGTNLLPGATFRFYYLNPSDPSGRTYVGSPTEVHSESFRLALIESTEFLADGTVKTYGATLTNPAMPAQTIESNQVTVTIRQRPVPTLSLPQGIPSGQFNIGVKFDKPVTGFTASDVQVVQDYSEGRIDFSYSVFGSGADYVVSVARVPFEGEFFGLKQLQFNIYSDAAVDENGTGSRFVLSPEFTFDNTQVVISPQIISIGGDNIITPGETVTIAVQDITLANIDQVVLANNGGSEYAIPFNGTAQVTIPTFIPAGTYTLRLREFA